MEKTHLRFVTIEVLERLARCDALLSELSQQAVFGNRNILGVIQGLQERLSLLESRVLDERELLIGILTDSGSQSAEERQALLRLLNLTYQALCQITQILVQVEKGEVLPELHLFLKDALPEAIQTENSMFAVVVDAEGTALFGETEKTLAALDFQNASFARLSVIEQQNPLAWVGLSQPILNKLAAGYMQNKKQDKALATALDKVAKEIEKSAPKNSENSIEESVQLLFAQSIGLRVLGPAYYFFLASQALLHNDLPQLSLSENALFYGLNHFNVAHNQTVILHEAVERALKEQAISPTVLSQAVLADLYKAAEKLVPERFAFSAKHLERAALLKERLAEGILLSSAPVFPAADVAQAFEKAAKDEGTPFPIYQLLSMTTEYPHTPREIVNAGWLHKVGRGAVWAFAALQEASQGTQVPYQKLASLFNAQDHLLAKSIETAELHRVLLCTPDTARA